VNQVGADPPGRLLGVGVGVPAAVDVGTGTVSPDAQNVPGLGGFALGQALRARTGLPVFVDNDANALALAEGAFGAARGASDYLLLTVGTGVGGAIMARGRLLRGAGGYAGEFGHMSLEPDGRPCFCGGRGCLKAYVSGPDIAAQARERVAGERSLLLEMAGGDAGDISARMVFAAAARGDSTAAALDDEGGQRLGAALGGLINAFNPPLMLLAGGVLLANPPLVASAATWAERYCYGPAFRACRLAPAALAKPAAVLGGAALVLYETGHWPPVRPRPGHGTARTRARPDGLFA
jgi:glucokinase